MRSESEKAKEPRHFALWEKYKLLGSILDVVGQKWG